MLDMKKPTKAEVKRILGALRRSKRKFVSLEALSRLVGLYSDVLAETLSYFEPMIRLDPTINTRDLTDQLEAYLEEPMKKASEGKPRRIAVPKKELAKYSSIADFVYKKMTSVGGLVDTAAKLSDEDLRVLQKLVELEVGKRKKATSKK